MTCANCGAYATEESRFCNSCGAPVAALATQPRNDLPEKVVFTLRPAFLFVGIKYVVAAIVWLLVTALVAAVASLAHLPVLVGALIVFVAGILIFLKPIASHIRRQRSLYTLTSHKLEIEEGILSRTVRNIPLSKIQDVTVTASLLNRMLGLGDIRIDNAAESLGQIVIAGVRDPKTYADMLLAELRRWT